MQAYAVNDDEVAGHAAVTLSQDDVDLRATFVPSLGMIGCSLRHRGAELLGQRGGLAKYAASGGFLDVHDLVHYVPLLRPQTPGAPC